MRQTPAMAAEPPARNFREDHGLDPADKSATLSRGWPVAVRRRQRQDPRKAGRSERRPGQSEFNMALEVFVGPRFPSGVHSDTESRELGRGRLEADLMTPDPQKRPGGINKTPGIHQRLRNFATASVRVRTCNFS